VDTDRVFRSPRTGIVVGVIGLVLLGAGWWLSGVGAAGTTRGPAPRLLGPHPPQALVGALQQYLARPRGPIQALPAPVPLPPRGLPSVPGTTCPVAAGGFCSLTPCVVFAGDAGGALGATVAAASAVLDRAVPTVSRTLSPAGTSCQGHPPPARTVPVGGL
jgi:hypothetical protein